MGNNIDDKNSPFNLSGHISQKNQTVSGQIKSNENVISGKLFGTAMRGYSAYELAVQQGFEGSLAEWLLSLIGPQGYSPTAKVTTEGNITTITLIDQQGTTEENIVTPILTSTREADGVRIDITDTSGSYSAKAFDGHSPVITASKKDHILTIKSDNNVIGTLHNPTAEVHKYGNTAMITVRDENGITSASITSPLVTVEKQGQKATIRIADENGLTTAEIFSPSVQVVKEDDTTTITLIDENGTTTSTIKDGHTPDLATERNGAEIVIKSDNAAIGSIFIPQATVSKQNGLTTITITDEKGTTTAQIQDGHSPTLTTERDGADMIIKSDGSSIGSFTVPRTAATKTGNTATITITDETGEHSAQIQDGHSPVISTTKSDNIMTVKSDDAAVGTITIPTANVRKQNGVATITVTDQDGSTEAAVSDGYSPSASVQTIPGGARITVEDADGTTSADVMAPVITTSKTGGTTTIESDGQPIGTVLDGAKGDPGVSPTVATSAISGGHRVTVTDADGSRSFDVMDGDAADVPVQDVQINGTSIVTDGVANVPAATPGVYGVVKPTSTYGVSIIGSGFLGLVQPTDAQIKAGSAYVAILPNKQHAATFYGLAKAAGDTTQSQSSNAVGTYTDEAKAAIQNMIMPEAPTEETALALLKEEVAQTSMFQSTLETIGGLFDGMPQDEALQEVVEELQRKTLLLEELYGVVGEGGVVHVDGSDPVIVAQPNRRYVCGEVASLTFTPCESGISDVVFSCGGTKTLLTLPETVKMPEDFDVELNTTYEINIMDGYLGVVGVWS